MTSRAWRRSSGATDGLVKVDPDNLYYARSKRHRKDLEAWRDDLAVVLVVEDTGVGISARDLKYIFDKFFQAAETQGRQIRGAGLGLAIVKNLVEAHNGRVSVKSNPGRGTSFQVLLPAAARVATEEALAG